MEEVVDGEYQAYKAKDGAYVRQHFIIIKKTTTKKHMQFTTNPEV
jgi:pyruvate dehydrogenase complex dehydrogenase (E1) component